ncbi:T9SS type A sorting domain-containing protein [bacterium AH-315-C07]|nr:T9SS type A sorting domain-containing protein [bacterium AH-315-C07]
MKYWKFIIIVLGWLTLSTNVKLIANTYLVTNTNDSGSGSLRQAIINANNNGSTDVIEFNISGMAPHTIMPLSPLPDIELTQPVIIDGTTQPANGYTGNNPKIILNGDSAGTYGLSIRAGYCEIYGLMIINFGTGIYDYDVGYLTVGAPGKGNVLSNNRSYGIYISSSNAKIQGNYIGTDTDSINNMGNGWDGIRLRNSSNSLVGGTGPGEGNVIAYNGSNGVTVFLGKFNRISQNSIFCNENEGIVLGGAGNDDYSTPVIIGADTNGVSGTASPNALIEIFEAGSCDTYCQGKNLIAVVSADSIGNWSYTGTIKALSISATATDTTSNNTSEFAACFELETGQTTDIYIVTNTNDIGIGSLRRAIAFTNQHPGADSIIFQIDGMAPHVIMPLSLLPRFRGDSTVIDGSTQPGNGYTGNSPRIILNGDSVTGIQTYYQTGLHLNQVNYCEVYGLFIKNFKENGIECFGSTNIIIGSPGNGNVISNNEREGISLLGSSKYVKIQGNKIGTDVDGISDLGNGYNGINFFQYSDSNLVGGINSGENNIIAYNKSNGVYVWSGNYNKISRNNIFCNSSKGISLGYGQTGNGNYPAPVIHNADTLGVSGTSSPNAILEIFADSSCTNFCQGKTYIVTVLADTSGYWSYSGTITAITLTASAIDPSSGNTSEFAACFELGTGQTADSYIVTNINDTGPGSLRRAIAFTEQHVGADSVIFDIGGMAPHEITPLSPLPQLNGDSAVIDGTTQPANGYTGDSPKIILNGDSAGSSTDGLTLRGDYSEIYGLLIKNFNQSGIGARGNKFIIGAPGKGNVINNNGNHGVYLYGLAKYAKIQGNKIGTDADGVTNMGNGGDGVHFWQYSDSNIVGGINSGEGNTIAYNGSNGVYVRIGEFNRISGNSIFCNGNKGIWLSTSGNDLHLSPVITSANNTEVIGTASPNDIVEIFYADSCANCEGKYYSGSTTADISGNWNYYGLGSVNAQITATATSPVNNTSEFSSCFISSFFRIDSLSGSVYCRGDSLLIYYSATSDFNPGNIFTAELSDTLGDFQIPTTIGTLSDTSLSGIIVGYLPIIITPGSNYRIRITTSMPFVISLDSADLTINGSPIIDLGNDSSVCDNVIIDAGPGFNSYSWSTDATTQGILVDSTGTYIVLGIAINGCTSTDTIVVTFNNKPDAIINIKGQTTFCDGDSVELIANTRTELSYQWYKDSIEINTATDSVYRATQPGNYTVKVTENGCDSLVSITLNINPAYFINTPGENICNGDSVMIFGIYRKTEGTYYDSLLTSDGCDSVITTTITISPTIFNTPGERICTGDSMLIFGIYRIATGIYYDSLLTSIGCDSVISTTLIVDDSIMISMSSKFVSCNGNNDGEVTVSAWGGTSPYQYLWSNNSTSETNSGLAEGTYTVTLTDNNGCKDISETTISEPSPFSIQLITNDESGAEAGDGSASVNVTGGASPYNYFWSNGATTSYANNLTSGNYSLSITDANQCDTAMSFKIDSVTTTDISAFNLQQIDFKVFPNPFKDETNITYTLNKETEVSIEVYDLLGKKISSITNERQQRGNYLYQIGTSETGIGNGVYLLKMEIENVVKFRRLVKL